MVMLTNYNAVKLQRSSVATKHKCI